MSNNNFTWQTFLINWNREVLSSNEVDKHLPPEAINLGWLGNVGATEEMLLTVEKGLGRKLPPSYREFLKVSDGWYMRGASVVEKLLSSWEIGWLNDLHPDVVSNWTNFFDLNNTHLGKTLQISTQEIAGTGIFLLNPEIVSNTGEWEVWFLAHWLPGLRRYSSFQDMMEEEFQSLLYSNQYQIEYKQNQPKIRRFEIINKVGTLISVSAMFLSFFYQSWFVLLSCLVAVISWRTYWNNQIIKITSGIYTTVSKRFSK